MNHPPSQVQFRQMRHAYLTWWIAFGVLFASGLYWGNSWEELLAYMAVLVAAVLPSFIWLRIGTPGIPILPTVSLLYIPYFAWPILNGGENTHAYTLWEIARAGLTVALFLAVATLAWRLVSGMARAREPGQSVDADTSRVVGLMFAGFVLGVAFHVALILGLLSGVGSLFGLVRSIATTFVTVACFLLGVTRARGVLRGTSWAASLSCLGIITILSWSTLFLVGGVTYLLAAALGFVLVSKRIPVVAFAMLFMAVSVLHAGKAEMRDKYWHFGTNYSDISASGVPGLLTEWVGDGIYALATGKMGDSVIERTSLIQMVLRAQVDTPDSVPFLNGETYALLPSVLIPRFIDPDKPESQAGMNLLNIRYGLLTVEGTEQTAIGWGLVAEAYANFGYVGVIGMGLFFGAACGALFLWSAQADIISIPTLTNIAVMMVLLNVESDFILIATTLFQSFAAVIAFSLFYQWFAFPQSDSRGVPVDTRRNGPVR